MNKKDEIYDRVVDGLIQADYRFGQPLAVKELASATGVSRQPIMTALNRLAADGFVRIIPQVGCQVVDPDRDTIADFYLLFGKLDGLLAELAAARRTDREVQQLAALQRRIDAVDRVAPDAAVDYIGLNRAFHGAIHAMARSPLLAAKQLSNFNMSDFFINQTVGFGAMLANASHDHDPMIAAIAAGDRDTARRRAEAHIGGIAEAVIAAFDAKAPVEAAPRRTGSHG